MQTSVFVKINAKIFWSFSWFWIVFKQSCNGLHPENNGILRKNTMNVLCYVNKISIQQNRWSAQQNPGVASIYKWIAERSKTAFKLDHVDAFYFLQKSKIFFWSRDIAVQSRQGGSNWKPIVFIKEINRKFYTKSIEIWCKPPLLTLRDNISASRTDFWLL